MVRYEYKFLWLYETFYTYCRRSLKSRLQCQLMNIIFRSDARQRDILGMWALFPIILRWWFRLIGHEAAGVSLVERLYAKVRHGDFKPVDEHCLEYKEAVAPARMISERRRGSL
jgi:hypothetical protein